MIMLAFVVVVVVVIFYRLIAVIIKRIVKYLWRKMMPWKLPGSFD